MSRRLRAWLGWLAAALLAAILASAPARAANCTMATAQGATGPANWQSYCWIDFSTYVDATARSAGGQNFSLALQDGTVLAFNMKVSGAAIAPSASPTWSGAAVGNTAFLGIAGKPALYQSAAGTTTIAISAITLTPPAGGGTVTSYMFVAGDAESSNDGESLKFVTNGGGWQLLDQSGPISGSTYPTAAGAGTGTYTVTGVAGTVGAYIVGTSTPTTLTTTLVGGGLQGAMFAVRFASIQLTTRITGARAAAADQFAFSINATNGGATLSAGTSSGTGLGPFTAASLSSTSALPLTLNQAMAAGSANAIGHYRSLLTCTNSAAGSTTPMPGGVATTSYSFGAMQFGDNVACTYTMTPYPHLTLAKALGGGGRQFANDQFELRIDAGTTTVATTTTTGTGTTVGNGVTTPYQATAGTTYRFYEQGAGATSLGQYTATMACSNAWSGSSTVLAGAPGGSITPQMGDVITCTITNTRIAANALLTILKSSSLVSDPVNGTNNPKFIPGAIVRYAFTVANTGPSAVDSNSLWLVDTLPATLSVGTAASPVFAQGTPGSGLTFTSGTDLRFSSASSPPASFAACNYTPVSAYDSAVRYVCLNPKGAMAGSTGTPPSFTLSIQARVN
ncbi:MAG: hypothetical protein KGM17_04275 [Sphingomonadales bacterium]|nr:hypothetical protein [Sphingomonadales bacterium]